MDTKNWNVLVVREGSAVEIGQVNEKTEVQARSAALARFGVGEYQVEISGVRPRGAAIYPDESFEVSLARQSGNGRALKRPAVQC